MYHGLLQKGLTYAMTKMLTHFQNEHLKFENTRTYEGLLEMNRDTVALAEVKEFVMDKVFTDFKDRATASMEKYYNQLMDQYTVLFGVFLVGLVGGVLWFFTVSYRQIKDIMWKTNLTLKIMPMEFIPRKCLPDLKKFFST